MILRPRAAVLAVALLAPTPAQAFVVPDGNEFHVNSYTTSYQFGAQACGNDDGTFVVAWHSYEQDGDQHGVFGQRFDATGASVGTEFQVNSYTTASQFLPSLCCDASGFVVAWSSNQDGSSYGIVGQRFDADGAPLGTEFAVNAYTTGGQFNPSVCCDPGGGFVVVWGGSSGLDGEQGGIFGRRFDAGAAPLGTDFQVNTFTTGDQDYPTVSCDAGGGFGVVWESSVGFAAPDDIIARRFDGDGAPLAADFVVNTYTTGDQAEPSICHGTDGSLLITWESGATGVDPPTHDGSGGAVVAQRYDATGAPNGTEFLVNVNQTLFTQRDPSAVCHDDDTFSVVYNTAISTASTEIRGQHFDADAVAIGGPFVVNEHTPGYQAAPNAVPAGDGFVVVWRSVYQEDNQDYGGVYGRRLRFSPTTTTTLPLGGVLAFEESEFQINTFTTNDQYAQGDRAVAQADDGSFVVVWRGSHLQNGVYGRRYDAQGAAAGPEFLVNTYTTAALGQPAVAMLDDGAFVVVWSSDHDGDESGVFGQRFDGGGGPVGTEFQVNSYTTSDQLHPHVDGGDDGAFVVVWETRGGQDGDDRGIAGQRFDAGGLADGTEFQVNSYTTDRQYRPAVARVAGQGFVVVWTNGRYAGYDGPNAAGQRFDTAGDAVGTEFVANTFTSGTQRDPSVDLAPDGSFVVVWNGYYQDGYGSSFFGSGIFGQRFDGAAAPVGTEIHVNSQLADTQRDADVTVNDDGSFMVVWESEEYGDGDNFGIVGRIFDTDAAALGEDFQINAYTTRDQFDPSVGSDGKGNYVVVWTDDNRHDGDGSGVFGQRFCVDRTADGICDDTVCVKAVTGGDLDIRPKLVMSKVGQDTTPGNDKLTFKAEMLLPLTTSFGDLDPATEGARIVIRSDAGDTLVDIQVPGGPDWTSNGAGNTWRLKDKAGTNNGIIKLQIKDRRKKGPNQIQVVAKGKNGDYPVSNADLPVDVSVVLGSQASGVAGKCGSTVFGAADCSTNGAGTKIKCTQ